MEKENDPTTARAQHPDKSNPFPIVALGASAGGLEAVRTLLGVMPADTGCAFVLIQHLDPSHKSMMVDLLARNTDMPVIEAAHGMAVAPDCVYVIPPQNFLSVCGGELRLSRPETPHRVHLPFDFFLRSLAENHGPRAIGVVLSGTGADGSAGLVAVDEAGGLVIAQNPDEAGYDGMPLSAIETGVVDRILPLADIPAALIDYAAVLAGDPVRGPGPAQPLGDASLAAIVDLLREATSQDFSHYTKGTLSRRIRRRMTIVATDSVDDYIDQLRNDGEECRMLAKHLLIRVTRFFRDTTHFRDFADKVVPDLLRKTAQGVPIRVWVPACSTGEEAYSIAMVLLDGFADAGRCPELRIFASDVSPEAIAFCRSGLYPPSIKADVPPEMLARYFRRVGGGYQVSDVLRNAITFTVQDLLADPPFSRLDLISCRSMLTYLDAGDQENVLRLFHYALRDEGYLWLGSAGAIGTLARYYKRVQDTEQFYHRIGHSTPRARHIASPGRDLTRMHLPRTMRAGDAPSSGLRAAVERRLLEINAPATVVVDSAGQAVYFLGPTDRYLRLAEGVPSENVGTMLREGLAAQYRAALRQAKREQGQSIVHGARMRRDGTDVMVRIAVHPMVHKGEDLLLVSFTDEPAEHGVPETHLPDPDDNGLKQELENTRRELADTIRDLEISTQDLIDFTEEAGMLNEEFMSTNEELEATREELQALNEELLTSNNQLQETLEERDKTASDLQNILSSSNIATLFLDADLNIRFFTPAAAPLFNLIPADIGRPLADMAISLTGIDLIADAKRVLAGQSSIKRDVVNARDVWFLCSMSPLRSEGDSIEGVVVNLADISDLAEAKQRAEQANLGKSRFLAATSHNLRQPLQTLSLILGAMKRQINNSKALALLGRAEASLAVMSAMLNTLLNINQLEAGVISPKFSKFPVKHILDAIRDEFAEEMAEKGLGWRVVPCGLTVRSDRVLLTDILRNLVSNAVRYTDAGSVLLGCRRRGDWISIELWDTGIGIAEDALTSIFEDHFRVSDAPKTGSFGLGLSIAHQLGALLGNPLEVRSTLGRGSVFSIRVPRASAADTRPKRPAEPSPPPSVPSRAAASATTVYVIDDDRAARDAMQALLEEVGYGVQTFADAATFLASCNPRDNCCVITDVRMPGMTGLELLARMAATDDRPPTIVVTGKGDIAMAVQALRAGATDFIEKPTAPDALLAAVDRALRQAARPAETSARQIAAASRFASLTKREREVTQLVVAGHANKEIAAKLGISQRTVETHRASAMKKVGAESISDLVRLEMAAQGH